MSDPENQGPLDQVSPMAGFVPPPDQPRKRSRWRAVLMGAFTILGILILGRFALTFLGAQVESALAGTVEFGTGGSGCSAEGTAQVFAREGTMHVVAHLRRDVTSNEVVHLTATYASGRVEATDTTVAETANCTFMDVPLAEVDAGRYVFDYRVGSESLASGEVVISP